MQSVMRWLMAATIVIAGVQVTRAQLVDPTTGVVVDPATDPVDFTAVAGGKPGNIGTELAAQAAAQAQKDAAQAMEQAQKAAADALEQAKAFANTTAQNASRTTTSSAPTSGSPGSRPATSTAARPVILPRGGTFHVAPGDSVLVTIKEKNPDAKIYYTTDGSRPTLQSAVYSGPIAVSSSETIKVLATGEHANASGVVTEKFKIKH